MQDKVYAVESYNRDENIYSRYEVGTRDEMMCLLNDLVTDDIKNENFSNYYRVNTVTISDKKEWDKQAEFLPDIDNIDKIFGDWISINVASKYLGVTFGRVFHMVTAGQLTVNQVGRSKLVSVHDVVDRKIHNYGPGRPASNNTAIEG